MDLSNPDDLSKAEEIYSILSKEFFDIIQKYLTENNLIDIPINNNPTEAEFIKIENDIQESEENLNAGRFNESFLIKHISIEKMILLIYFKLFGKKIKFNNENRIDDVIRQIEDELERNMVDHKKFGYWRNIRNRISHENYKINGEQAERGNIFLNNFSNNLKEAIEELS